MGTRPVGTQSRSGGRRIAWIGIALTTLAILGGACTSEPSTGDQAAATTAPGTSVPERPAAADTTTPLVITTLGFDAVPVQATDDRFHVAYELSVLNYHPNPAVITTLETLAPDGRVVSSWSQDELSALTMVVPDLGLTGAPDGIPPGGTAILVLEDVYPDRASVPDVVTHRITATFAPVAGTPAPRVALFPASATETGGPVTTSTDEPVAIGAPVAGDGWVIGYGCCDAVNGHRGAMLPIAGTINGTERFAIDFGRVSGDLEPGAPVADEVLWHPGTDGTKNEDFLSYGSPLLAVGDGTVVQVSDDVADTAPGAMPGGDEGLDVSDVGGNVVVLELAPDLFAFYLHNAPGSTTVKVGDTVAKGQQIARLGSSGNSLAPHLHFQLGRSRQMLAAENVPYVFDELVVVGSLSDAGFVAEPTPGPRRSVFPLRDDVVDLPAAP